MKKFLVASTLVFILAVGFLGDIVSNKITAQNDIYFVKANNEEIYIAIDNKWQKLDIVGVNLDSSKPGNFPNDKEVTEEEYLNWLKIIYDMGANCVKVPDIMEPDFYNALDKFNQDKEKTIYVIQGIYFDEVDLKNGKDIQSEELEEKFKNNMELIVDSIHGSSFNLEGAVENEYYKTDISKYLLGYTLGVEFASHDLIYTELINNKENYNGKYFYTNKDASSFESYIAKMADYLAKYEYKKYKEQRLIGFIGSSNNHKKLKVSHTNEEKYINDYVNPNNIKSKYRFKPGIFASYSLYPSYTNMKEYQNNIEGYLTELKKMHKIPIIIGEYGIPSSRNSGDFNVDTTKIYINEEEQGKALVDAYRAIQNAKLAGSFIFELQDSWHRTSWNTKESKILDRAPFWSDAQDYSQNFGLIAFDPGKEKSDSYPDDNISEWQEKDVISKNDDISLSMKSDEKYLYFMLKSKNTIDLDKQDIYIDLDITPNSGSTKSSQLNLNFDNPVDFIIEIKNKENAKVLVHEYYNYFSFNENKKENQIRPDLISVSPDMDEFSPIYIEITPRMYVEALDKVVDSKKIETGKLVYGNANPLSKSYNSASDFYIGDDYVEIRVPWALLNFMDPSTKQIMDDIYKYYRAKPMIINTINIGATIKENESIKIKLDSSIFRLKSWFKPEYHQRLKRSYDIIKDMLNTRNN
ncbi:hypothetical protein [Romboutsia ilealis]|uniref:hypothetical protein n=1 Tax=Romboutsia ilealis TaxID=1115758 RepID=UPI002896B88A|nr:hypothetical protein [Romboutsia ilealis]